MKKICSAVIMATFLVASSAFATGNHPPKNPPPAPTTPSKATGVGIGVGIGQGGQGGKASSSATGGNANATGGKASASIGDINVKGGTSTSSSDQHQSQRQHQGQDQNQSATGISGGSFGGSSNQTQQASSSADNSGNNTGSGNVTEVSVGGDVYQARRIPVSTAYAASLTSGVDTCLGSASGGMQLPVVGVSLGKTTLDKGCKLIKETHLLREFGTTEFERAACFRARSGKEGKEIDAAMKAAGIDCAAIVTASDSYVEAPRHPVVPPYVTHEELRIHEDRIVKKVLQK